MELKNETEELLSAARQFFIAQMQNRCRTDLDRAGIRFIQQTEDVEEGALAAARRTDHCVQAAGGDVDRDAAQCVDAFLLFAEIALDIAAAERNFSVHKLEPRRVSTG